MWDYLLVGKLVLWLQEQPLIASSTRMSVMPPPSTEFPTLEVAVSPENGQPNSSQISSANYANASQEFRRQEQNIMGNSKDAEVFLNFVRLMFQVLLYLRRAME